jgi:NAD-dependent SIR2 family protein deacetylase
MNTDGNLDAIDRHLEAQERQERHDAAQLVYCLDCNESIPIEDWPDHEYKGTCPNCETELAEMK